jgi:hypothetical protein
VLEKHALLKGGGVKGGGVNKVILLIAKAAVFTETVAAQSCNFRHT